jgi:hypothetical protein
MLRCPLEPLDYSLPLKISDPTENYVLYFVGPVANDSS